MALALEPLWGIESLPFTIGTFTVPHNPGGLPDTLSFSLGLDTRLGLVRQVPEPAVVACLRNAYNFGSLLGTAMDDTGLGRGYADDFLDFAASVRAIKGSRVLEIGAGRGYLVRRFRDLGAEAIGVEPGRQNAASWAKYKVTVIPGLFPDAVLNRQFDVIAAHAVLEHEADTGRMLSAVHDRLAPGGVFMISVQDESAYIAAGDPGMLLHEHFSYFTPASLSRTLADAGFRILSLKRAGYGGAIYCAATPDSSTHILPSPEAEELTAARAFAGKCLTARARIVAELRAASARNHQIGVYCPARGLATLPQTGAFRFFDDDPELWGRYYPPFAVPVEPRAALLERPVDQLLILSHTFGARLKSELVSDVRLARCSISTITELLGPQSR